MMRLSYLYKVIVDLQLMIATSTKKKLLVVSTNNLFNLKSNTMKNTMQNYAFYVMQHNFSTRKYVNFAYFNQNIPFKPCCTSFFSKIAPKTHPDTKRPEADTLRGAVFYKSLRQQQSLWVYCDKNLLNLSDNQ